MYPDGETENRMLLLDDNLIVPLKTIEELADKVLATEWGQNDTITQLSIEAFPDAKLMSGKCGDATPRKVSNENGDHYKIYQRERMLESNHDEIVVTKHNKIVIPSNLRLQEMKRSHRGDIISILEKVFKSPSKGNAFIGRFGTGNILVYMPRQDSIHTTAKEKILEKIKKGCVQFTHKLTDKHKEEYKCVFNNVYPLLNFEIWQLKNDPKNINARKKKIEKDKFNPNNIHCALDKLTKLQGEEKKCRDDKNIQQLVELLKCEHKATLRAKGKRKVTRNIMGCSANDFAREMVGGNGKLNNEYEWLHCGAHCLVNRADESRNLMCGTAEANTWMIVYELIAKLALMWGPRATPMVTIECKFCWKSTSDEKQSKIEYEYTPYAPPEIEYIVKLYRIPVCRQHLDILRFDLPSRWIYSVVTEFYGRGIFSRKHFSPLQYKEIFDNDHEHLQKFGQK